MNLDAIPWSFSTIVENGGGSTITPRELIQIMYPDVLALGSNPCELPSTVTPNSGGWNVRRMPRISPAAIVVLFLGDLSGTYINDLLP